MRITENPKITLTSLILVLEKNYKIHVTFLLEEDLQQIRTINLATKAFLYLPSILLQVHLLSVADFISPSLQIVSPKGGEKLQSLLKNNRRVY